MNTIDGTYRITGTLATGGTAVLFKAVQTSLDRTVVVKRLHAHLAAEPGFAERFELEAKAAARLDHGNIVRIIDFGEDRDGHFIVMEHIDGPSLKEVLAARPVLGDDLTLLAAREICLGLGHAHRRGVIHRDIKPGNVMIARDGRVVITDFGLAKLHRPEAQQTVASTLLGTPLYMSPEQAAGEAIDGRSDLFSLGTICYEALTGTQPFFGDTYAAVIRKILQGVSVEPRKRRSDVRPETEAIVMKALELDPAKRFRDAAEMARAIEETLGGPAVAAARERLRRLACGADDAARSRPRRPKARRGRSPARALAIAAGAAALVAIAAAHTGFLGVLPQSIRAGFADPAPPSRETIPAVLGEPLPGVTMTPIDEPVPGPGDFRGPAPAGDPAADSTARGGTDDGALDAPPPREIPDGDVSPPGADTPSPEAEIPAGAPEAPAPRETPAAPATVPDAGASPEATAVSPAPSATGARPPRAAETGYIDIAVEPAASIIIDGEPVTASGRISMLEIAAGPHEIVCRREGYRDYVETVRIAKGELSRRRVVLAEVAGSLLVESDPGARLYVDGAYRGALPLARALPLAPGAHRIELRKPGYRSWSTDVHVPVEEPLRIAIRLVPVSDGQ